MRSVQSVIDLRPPRHFSLSMPGIKPTNEQLLERVEFVQELICRGVTYGTIKRLVRSKFGPMHHTTIGRLVLRARKAFTREIARLDLTEARAEQVRFCRSIMANPETRPADKLKASERIASLLGLDMPHRVDVAAKHIHTVKKPVAIDYAELDRLRRNLQGVPSSDGGEQSLSITGTDSTSGVVSGADRN